MANASGFDREFERERELGAVVALQLLGRKRKGVPELAEEGEARVLIQARAEPEHAQARAVVQRRVLIHLLALKLEDLDVHLDEITGSLLFKQLQLRI